MDLSSPLMPIYFTAPTVTPFANTSAGALNRLTMPAPSPAFRPHPGLCAHALPLHKN